jgi:fucose permease
MTAQSLRDEVSPLLDDHNITHAGLDNAARQPKTHRVFNRTNTPPVLRIAATMYSFAVIGLFTSTIGALLPSISHHYALNDTRVSLIFLLGPIGYVFAAQTNAYIHTRFGQVGVATIGPIFHIVSAGVIALHPPFPVLLLSFIFAAIGTGLLDGSWCAWAGGMSKANTISGMLHGSFSVGAAVGPFLAGALMIKGLRPWYEWYYILVSFVAL